MKSRVFHVTNGTVFSGWLDQAALAHHVPSFAKIRNKQKGKQIMADCLPHLLALELHDDSEVKISGVLGEDDDITLFSVASSYMCRK